MHFLRQSHRIRYLRVTFSFFDGAEKKKEYYDVEDRNDIKKIGLTESVKAFLSPIS